jgi:hypothetical protein
MHRPGFQYDFDKMILEDDQHLLRRQWIAGVKEKF